MRNPFIYQSSFWDCVPVSFLNAITYLFDREEIPPTVIQRIWIYSMDRIGKKQKFGRGTTKYAVQLIAQWLESYRTPNFKVEYEFLIGDEVNLSKGNEIEECFDEGGVALCHLHMGRHGHYALALRSDSKRVYFFDPYLRVRIQGCDTHVQLLKTDGYGPNLSISKKWLDQRNPGKRKFCFGGMDEREALLLWRV